MTAKEKDGRRVYDKQNSCFFCGKQYSKLARHFFQVYKDEEEVAKIISMKANNQTRKLQLEKLCRMGNYNHNLKVLEIKKGELKLVRRPTEDGDTNSANYLPCQHCHGFFSAKDLKRHNPKCPSAGESDKNVASKKLQHVGRLLLASNKFPTGSSQQLSDNVLFANNGFGQHKLSRSARRRYSYGGLDFNREPRKRKSRGSIATNATPCSCSNTSSRIV